MAALIPNAERNRFTFQTYHRVDMKYILVRSHSEIPFGRVNLGDSSDG